MDKIQIGDITFSTYCSKIIRAWLNVETNEEAINLIPSTGVRLNLHQQINFYELDKIQYEIRNDPFGYIQKWDHLFKTWQNWIPLYCDPNEDNTCFEILEEATCQK